MKISSQPLFRNQTGSAAKSDDSKATGQTQASVTKTAAGVGDARDSFERMSAIDTRGRIFGSAMGAPSASRPAIPEMKWVYGEGNPADMETDTPGKQPFDIEEAVQWTVSRDGMEQQLDEGTARTTEEAREQIRVRDSMDALIRTMDEAEYSKVFDLRRDPTRGAGTPESAPTMIKVDKLGGSGDGEAGAGPEPGQGGSLTGAQAGGGEAGGSITPHGVGFGGFQGGFGGRRITSGNGTQESTPPDNESDEPHENSPQKGGEPREARPSGTGSSSSSSPSGTANETQEPGGGTTCEQPSSETDPWDYVNTGVERQVCRDETGLPPADESSGGKGGDDVGPRGLPEAARISQQERDLVGPAFATQTGADDKERPATGGTSGAVGAMPRDPEHLGEDLPFQKNYVGGSIDAALYKDPRKLNPIDPSKV